ncbi:penicillin-binding transpeptidase domain-containing protein, partial [Breznakiellaceae bacterium SP9]
WGVQSYAERQLQTELDALTNNRVSNGSIIAIENATGAVLVYVGSVSWFDDSVSGKIDGVRALNQPGSCLKPFLYAKALDEGVSPAEILPDIPTVFGTSQAYIPSNFNRRFNGPVRFRVALASSLNIPAVYLLDRLGIRTFEDYLIALGFDSIKAKRGTYGAGLALGNAAVSLEELVRAFSAFPRGGSVPPLRFVLSDETSDTSTGAAAMSNYAAWEIADILSDKASRFVGFGPAPTFATDFPSMFKTGTANQFQHIWALGASPRYTVGVWMGNFSGETIVGRTGSSIPARIVANLLKTLEQAYSKGGGERSSGSNPAGSEIPAAAVAQQICALSGMAAGPLCTGILMEYFLPKQVPAPCTWHGAPGGDVVYPPEYQAWLGERFRAGRVASSSGNGRIRLPAPGSVYFFDPGIPRAAQAVRLETNGFAADAFVYMDGQLQGALSPNGVYALPLHKGRHTVLVEDENGGSAQVEYDVR